jgi:predicted AAA+ superfamily ATPase
MKDLEKFLNRAEQLMARIEGVLPAPVPAIDWSASIAFRWRKTRGAGFVQPVRHPHRIRLSDLRDIDRQKALVDANTRQFVEGRPANNVLLTGARGTGKSSLIKACLNRYAGKGLRLIEVDKGDLIDLPDIADQLEGRKERFIIFCDDLSFEASESAYKALKAILDGSVAAPPDNVLVYATSNRRHLMPEYMQENLETKYLGDEIHPGETVEEKISLSERFGLWVSFYPFDQDAYIDIVDYWLGEFGCTGDAERAREAALQWALLRGSRSGRVAWQFARDWAGRQSSPRAAVKKPQRR